MGYKQQDWYIPIVTRAEILVKFNGSLTEEEAHAAYVEGDYRSVHLHSVDLDEAVIDDEFDDV